MREERGNIYVEALIAVAVLAIGLLPIFGGWTLSARASVDTAQKQTALALARSYLEPLHGLNGSSWDALPTSEPITDAANPNYAIRRTAAARPDVAGLKDVTVTVTWVNQKGATQSLSLATAVARRP